MTEDIKNLTKSVDVIAQTTAKILETMATKKDLEGFATKEDLNGLATKKDLASTEFRLQKQISGIETDLKSFKQETRENFDQVNEKLDDLHDTATNHDKRIEVLEEKVLR